jgi:3'-phosphoadenosine 5'-phosphosulfate sulfotransferase (PAPS reductase)/FAD synthetase
MDYIVSYSGGLGSFLAAHKLKQEKPNARVRLVFCDTLIEDEDLYRFLDESAKALDLELIKIADGRTPWELFNDMGFQGNSRIAPCSSQLKRKVFNSWLADNYPDRDFIVVMGIGHEESERLERARKNNKYEIIAPLCEKPYYFKEDQEKILKQYSLKKPRLYDLGFPHNNCGGFCVRTGLAQFELLYKTFPERFKFHEEQQEKLIREVPKANKPFLRKRINNQLQYITLKEFRIKYLNLSQLELFDFGGCGCFVDDEI